MKKLTICILTLCFMFSTFAQTSEEDKVKQTIIDFFDAFHKQDTVKLKSMAKGNINMQSISVNREGKTRLDENDYEKFIKSIAGIPKDKKFEEKLLDFNIKIDGKMANAWTPYEFWFDGNFSHCGVNSFQLVKEDNDWKIIYLVDTRRRQGCKALSKG
ncbi:MAG: nuclear transport factor 2 family protein [Winogradskyella sp.]|nr:MAG: nuclear transport factor 2 family protein [Winogradskyella sp.]